MAIITIGIDLAKNIFSMHGMDESGKPALVRPNVKRAAVPHWHGGLLSRAPLGARVCQVWPYAPLDGAQVRDAVPPVGQERQKRCS